MKGAGGIRRVVITNALLCEQYDANVRDAPVRHRVGDDPIDGGTILRQKDRRQEEKVSAEFLRVH